MKNRWKKIPKRIIAEHFMGHTGSEEFDFYCVAHGSDYSPKYLNGEVCHDSYEGYCSDFCNLCPVDCPIEPCPLNEDDI